MIKGKCISSPNLCEYEYCLFALVNCNVNQHHDFCMLHDTSDTDCKIVSSIVASLFLYSESFSVVDTSLSQKDGTDSHVCVMQTADNGSVNKKTWLN